jgi:Reverse transcriptase (RNA-dependent DNA polymerase)
MVEETEGIPILAYADDLVLIANNTKDMHNMFSMVDEFCAHSSMEISPSKSAYTYNNCKTPSAPI